MVSNCRAPIGPNPSSLLMTVVWMSAIVWRCPRTSSTDCSCPSGANGARTPTMTRTAPSD
ncbi:MAG: hypothetical protein DMF85_07620 [Acidobacteria bacterium]|nr:MAG: hypothetical protein DMF85_07620 [Acidobacteriota bacterium]